MAKKTEKIGKITLGFAAIDPFLVNNIADANEKENRAQGYISWGSDNRYPNYLYDLYMNVPTLHSIINGMVDYVIGDGVESNIQGMSDAEAKKLAKSITKSLVVYGGCALNVLRNRLGKVAKVVPLDMRCVRTNKNNTAVFYADRWRENKTYSVKLNIEQIGAYNALEPEPNSILYWKNTEFQTYPSPMYAGAAIACETERQINEYGINALKNGFTSNLVVNLNNGTPSDEQKEEIEKNFAEKFCGSQNAGRPVLSFNEDKDHAVSIESVSVDDWSDRFKSVKDRSRQEIFTAFRANPNLFGIATENLGFSTEEYESAFKLFARTVILPLQQDVCSIIDSIYGEGAITIYPYTIDFDGNKQDVTEVETNDVTIKDNE